MTRSDSTFPKVDIASYILNPALRFFRLSGRAYAFLPGETNACLALNAEMEKWLAQFKMGIGGRNFPPWWYDDKRVHNVIEGLVRHNVLTPIDGPVAASEQRSRPKSNALITIIPTSECNLRCTYCYSKAQRPGEGTLRRSMLDIAIDHFFSGISSGQRQVTMLFHGGGEPTYVADILMYAHNRIVQASASAGISLKKCIVSNGVFGKSIMEWLARERFEVVVSLDGTSEIHNRQRPAADSRDSHAVAVENVRSLSQRGVYVNLRATVTRDSLAHLDECVQQAQDLGINSITLEPVRLAYPKITTDVNAPSLTDFNQAFFDAFFSGLRVGVDVKTAGLVCFRRAREKYCGACQPDFGIAPGGYITSCPEVTALDGSSMEAFIYGKVHGSSGRVELDYRKMQNLAGRSVENMKTCSGCLLTWSCAGGCPAQAVRSRGGLLKRKKDECQTNVALNARIISSVADGKISRRGASSSQVFESEFRVDHRIPKEKGAVAKIRIVPVRSLYASRDVSLYEAITGIGSMSQQRRVSLFVLGAGYRPIELGEDSPQTRLTSGEFEFDG